MKISDIKEYVVEYQLPYVHFVQVGVMAESSEAAIKAAQAAFDLGTIWDNTPTMPLLTDLYDETSNSTEPFQPLKFEAEEVEEWPQPDPTVRQIERENAAMEACRLLYQAYEHQDSGDATLADNRAGRTWRDGSVDRLQSTELGHCARFRRRWCQYSRACGNHT
jgi:hypothetical protein